MMNPVDPDIADVLKTVAASGEALRVAKVKDRHRKLTEERLNTLIELMGDKLEAILPRDNPLFVPVLAAAVLRKLERMREQQTESEYKSCLDESLPNPNW